jgi:hypothetical protein
MLKKMIMHIGSRKSFRKYLAVEYGKSQRIPLSRQKRHGGKKGLSREGSMNRY